VTNDPSALCGALVYVAVSAELHFEPTETRLLFGRADEALKKYANEAGIEVIVVGARGHGLSEALFGSVTSRLVGGCEVPVLVGPKRVK
jgi:nucleotide-binding universal stress UspA family protein